MTTAIDIEVNSSPVHKKKGRDPCDKCLKAFEQERTALQQRQIELLNEVEGLKQEMAGLVAQANVNSSSYASFGLNGQEQRYSNPSPINQPDQQPKEDNIELVLKPFLDQINDFGDEIYFQLPSSGRIYKFSMHADDLQQVDLDDLKQNFEAQEAAAEVIYLE